MRHMLVIVVVICAVICEGWAQSRGRVRYVPPEDIDDDITRAPLQTPTRGAAVRRQRPTKAPEPTAVEDELKAFQPPEIPARTTARRVPQRGTPQQIAPPPPPPHVTIEDSVPRYSTPVEELPEVPPSAPEGRPQNTRRRRPKKRRKPQAAEPKAVEEPGKQLAVSEEHKTAISELLNEDKKRNEEFQNNPRSRHAPPSYENVPSFQPEKATWENNPTAGDYANVARTQYFRPQSATNRLPIGEAEPIGNSRRYPESSPATPDIDSPSPYVPPKRSQSSISNEASYVPVLHPVRGPSNDASRLPPEDYPSIRNEQPTRHTLPVDASTSLRGHGDRSPVPDPNEIIHNTGVRPAHNIIPQPDIPVVPNRSHSEVRLPQDELPLISEYAPLDFDSEDLTAPNAKTSDEVGELPNTSNRLPNPSEIHYESVYPEFSNTPTRGSHRIAGRRQEADEPTVRNPLPSYTSPRRDTSTKPQEYDNDAEVDRRQASQYRPPLQRGGSRYKPEDLEASSRSRTEDHTPSTSSPRTRGSSRYQSSPEEYVPERTRSSTRTQSEPTVDSPSRSRSSSTSHSTTTRTRGSQRYALDTNENAAPAPSSRRQPVNAVPPQRNTQSTGYVPIDEIIESPPSPQSHSPRISNQPSENYRDANSPEDITLLKNTLRSRPQYDIREAEPAHTYEESVDDPDVYNTEYQVPRQTSTRGRTNERTIDSRQQPPQPEYQVPQNRQEYRPEPQYVPPQNPRSRQQHQYEAPQNPRTDTRQTNNRQSLQSSRQQGRPRQSPEPSAPPRRSSGGSNFVCPESFGFFADPVQCDKYYECRNGTAEMNLCKDGLAFNAISSPKFLRCDSLRDVDCKSRPELQEPQPSKNCPRRFGLFAHETDCTKFWNCVDGAATEVQCPPGLTYNDDRATCDWADLVESSCKSEDLLGFTCPEPNAHDLQDGVYTRYPHPKNCQLHYTCIKGADGLRRPRLLSCNDGQVFDPSTERCSRPDDVPGCEDFYGDIRAPPKKKPARQPAAREPEEEILEEPTPRPRRRGSNRRTRN